MSLPDHPLFGLGRRESHGAESPGISLLRCSLVVAVVLALVGFPTAVAGAHIATPVSEPAQTTGLSEIQPVSNSGGGDATGASEGVSGESALSPTTVYELAGDSDGDGLLDEQERTHGTDPTNADTDADGLHDGPEVYRFQTDPTKADSDGDGLTDGAEVSIGSAPARLDTDADGLDDGVEMDSGTDPTRSDTDGDGLDDRFELEKPTDPVAADTDGDGLDDGVETKRGTDPTRPDTDGDGVTDGAEVTMLGTDPAAADTDGDFLSDGSERNLGTDPTDWLSPLSVPGVVGGFVSGMLLSVGLMTGWRRSKQSLRALPLVGELIETYAATNDGRVTDSNERDDLSAPEDDIGTDADTVANEELLPDDVRVQQLLEHEGGRMKQSTIVEMTEWSKSKVSRLLTSMTEKGEVIKVMLGRENLICLPGHEPAIVRNSTGG